jgi:hypothetical protein
MGSIKRGKLISRCLDALNVKLDTYFNLPINQRKEFDYFELGKIIIWEEYEKLIKKEPSYKMYHISSDRDGTRDIDGYWVSPNLIFKKNIIYKNPNNLLLVTLANSIYCGKDPKYNWFCGLSREEILNGDYFISKLFKKALKL